MKKQVLSHCVLAFFLFSTASLAQAPVFEWAKDFNIAQGSMISAIESNSIVADTSGNVYSTGNFSGTADFDPGPGQYNLVSGSSGLAMSSYVLKLDGQGNFVWAKCIGDTGNVQTNSLAIDASGNLYLSGSFTQTSDFDPGPGVFTLSKTGSRDAFVEKLDANGDLVWAKSFGGTLSYIQNMFLTCDLAGNTFATASFNGTVDTDPGAAVQNVVASSNNYSDLFLVKLDASGNYLWHDLFAGPQNELCLSLSADNAGNVLACGQFMGTVDFDPGAGVTNLTSGGSYDVFIMKLNSGNGNLVWAKNVGAALMDVSVAICSDQKGNVYSSGAFNSTVDFDPGPGVYTVTGPVGNPNPFVLKLSSAGDFVWVKTWSIPSCGYGFYFTMDALENLYMTGNFKGTVDFDPAAPVFNCSSYSSAVAGMFLLKLDSAGSFQWALSVSGTENTYGNSIVVADDFSIFSTGVFNSLTDFDPGSGVFNLAALNQSEMYMHKMSQNGPNGIQEAAQVSSLSVYPNPGNGLFTIRANEPVEELVVTDALGKEVLRMKMNAPYATLDLSREGAGIYFLRTTGNSRQALRLIVQ